MQPGNHVHIISAGENIQNAFPALLRELPGISRLYVISDGETYGTSSNPAIDTQRAATRHAVEVVKELASSLSLPFGRETVFAPVFPTVRRVLARIGRENPRARFTFDLSAGSKDLCMALLSCAPWMGGEVWNAFDKKIPERVPVPDRNVRPLMANVNYLTILAVLLRNRPVPQNPPDLPFVPRQYLYNQVWPYYIRNRTRATKPGKPGGVFPRGRVQANDLSQQTFSTFLATLRTAGLVEEAQDTKNRKEKAYRITVTGETAFRFFSDPAANSIIKQVLEGP